MLLNDGGRDGPAPEPKAFEGSRPSWLPSRDGETAWLMRSCCIRSFTDLPEGGLSDPSERASLGLPEDEREGWAGLLGLVSYVGALFFVIGPLRRVSWLKKITCGGGAEKEAQLQPYGYNPTILCLVRRTKSRNRRSYSSIVQVSNFPAYCDHEAEA